MKEIAFGTQVQMNNARPLSKHSQIWGERMRGSYIGPITIEEKIFYAVWSGTEIKVSPFLPLVLPEDPMPDPRAHEHEWAAWLHKQGVALVRWKNYWEDDEGHIDWIRTFDASKEEIYIGGFDPEYELTNFVWNYDYGIWEMTCPTGAVRQVGHAYVPDHTVYEEYSPGEEEL